MTAAGPQTALIQLESAILTDIVSQFANSCQSTTRWSLLVKFEGQPAPAAINNLVNRNFVVRHGASTGEEAYLPNAVAFHFSAESELRARAKLATTIVLHTVKQMFKGARKKEGFTFEDLKQHVEYIYPNRIFDSSTLKLGLYLSKDFGVLQGYRLNPPDDTEVTWFQIGESAISMADPDGEWDRVMAQYKWNGPDGSVETKREENSGPGREDRWERVGGLGGGGQSDVFLVRRPERSTDRRYYEGKLRNALESRNASELAKAAWSYARPEEEAELAALKVFKIPPEAEGLTPVPESEEYEAIKRLENEINVLKQGRPGLPKLLDSNLKERWIVTEYLSGRTLKDRPLTFKAKPAIALKAFRSLVYTVASLHKDGYVHRDIKPANVFIRADDELILGDFGIVYLSADARVTQIGERVGPRDYMPPWAHQGKRIDQVDANWDVYMLGKLLWCMVDGRSFLPREILTSLTSI